MPLDIIYNGTEKEKELMKEWINPCWKTDPKNSHSNLLDLIILGEHHYKNIKAGRIDLRKTTIVAEPLLVNGEYAHFTGAEGELYQIKNGKEILENSGVNEFLKKYPKFVVSLKPTDEVLHFYGNNLNKILTLKADREGVSFITKSGSMYLESKLFYFPDVY